MIPRHDLCRRKLFEDYPELGKLLVSWETMTFYSSSWPKKKKKKEGNTQDIYYSEFPKELLKYKL